MFLQEPNFSKDFYGKVGSDWLLLYFKQNLLNPRGNLGLANANQATIEQTKPLAAY